MARANYPSLPVDGRRFLREDWRKATFGYVASTLLLSSKIVKFSAEKVFGTVTQSRQLNVVGES